MSRIPSPSGALQGLLRRSPVQRRSRAVVKTLCYRALMVLITVVVALVVTESVAAALEIGVVANVIKTGTYYGYERLWDRIAWGV